MEVHAEMTQDQQAGKYVRGRRRDGRRIRRWAIPGISAMIAFVWVFQFVVSIPLFPFANRLRRSWPFLDYPMYSWPHYDGDTISRFAVVGIQADGEELQIRPEDLGIGYWHFQIFVRAIRGADHATVRGMAQLYETRQNVRLARLRVENRPLVFSNSNLMQAPIETIVEYPLDPAQEREGPR
jgi:hypothetical protein